MDTLTKSTKSPEGLAMSNSNAMSTRDLLKQAWIQSGAYRTESLVQYTDRVMGVKS